ncbi:MAG: hypothetical protein GX189_01245 [Clostridiales bacterium]|nr:hypothetical protein [Clostridiales bacterium]
MPHHTHHDHDHHHPHDHDHDTLLKSVTEVAKFLQYTLQHNAHHEEELESLAHSLDHLSKTAEADEIRACIAELKKVDARLAALLDILS